MLLNKNSVRLDQFEDANANIEIFQKVSQDATTISEIPRNSDGSREKCLAYQVEIVSSIPDDASALKVIQNKSGHL